MDLPELKLQYQGATASTPPQRQPRTIKHGDSFAVFDHYGDLSGLPGNPEGLYHQDTRFLSSLHLMIGSQRPLLLSSTVNDNAMFSIDLTNPDVYRGKVLVLRRDTVHLLRSKFLWASGCHERIAAHNFGSETLTIVLTLDFNADFSDIFEVRGHARPYTGRMERFVAARDRVILRYLGLDNRKRETQLSFDPVPDRLLDHQAEWQVTLRPQERKAVYIMTGFDIAGPVACHFTGNFRRSERERLRAYRAQPAITTSNHIFNELLIRCTADLSMLLTDTRYGPYPYAGIPWYSTVFGRDGIITAIEMLAFDPRPALGVLNHLAVRQAQSLEKARDAEPGKILHETRQGEMAALGEIPFGLYYGSIDSTPLFVLLAGLYWRRTGDKKAILRLWPNILAALNWIDQYGDADGDGLVEYLRKSPNGLMNQGWKDSEDSVFHADGSLAQGSIAMCEVQAYVYSAKSYASRMARALGDLELAERMEREALALRSRFEERFWMEDRGFYALALDGEKKPCRVLTSNAGHALFCGIASAEHASKLASRLLEHDLFSGWGIRTVGVKEARYNPMSYHNGSVWPHDNALIALGLARYGHMNEALKVLTGLFDASTYMDLRRLPELFCGFRRRPARGPTSYPVACSPQAWASACPFALLSAALGLELDAQEDTVKFRHPQLPDFIDEVEIRNLRLGASALDVLLRRRGHAVAVTVLEKSGPAGVEVLL